MMNNPNMRGNPFDHVFREGTQLLHEGKPREAIPFLEQAIELQPENIDAAINLSGALILNRKFRQAIAILEPFKDLPSENPMVWINLGAAYLGNPVLAREEEQMAAISAFLRALEIDPLATSVAYNIGIIYEDRKEIEESVKWFEQALKANPNDEHARRKIARLQAHHNNDQDSTEMN